MDDSTESPVSAAPPIEEAHPTRSKAGLLSCALAGLQAGMLGAIGMLTWLSIDSSWDRRGFWTEENLFSSFFYGSDAVHSGFGSKTMPGIALYLIVYSLLGAIFAYLVRRRFRPLRTILFALLFALGWYYLSFHLLWKHAMPLVYLLYADRPMMAGHLVYGACLAAFPSYLPGAKHAPIAPSVVEEALPPEPDAVEVVGPGEAILPPE